MKATLGNFTFDDTAGTITHNERGVVQTFTPEGAENAYLDFDAMATGELRKTDPWMFEPIYDARGRKIN